MSLSSAQQTQPCSCSGSCVRCQVTKRVCAKSLLIATVNSWPAMSHSRLQASAVFYDGPADHRPRRYGGEVPIPGEWDEAVGETAESLAARQVRAAVPGWPGVLVSLQDQPEDGAGLSLQLIPGLSKTIKTTSPSRVPSNEWKFTLCQCENIQANGEMT